MSWSFTVESVTEDHLEMVVGAYHAGDREARMACEVLVTPCQIILAGEITFNAKGVELSPVRDVHADISYETGGRYLIKSA